MRLQSKAIFSIAVIILASATVCADDLKAEKTSRGPKNGITLGPSMGWVGGEPIESGISTGLDISYFHRIVFPLYFWVSGGARAWIDNGEMPILPYVETGFGVVVLNAGVGYGPGVNTGSEISHNINIFVGLNAPIWSPKKGQMFYVEPYYRPTWNLLEGGNTISHEIGGTIKWCLGWTKDHRL